MLMHESPISGISSHKKFIATAGYDNKVILWDRNHKEPIARVFHDHLVNHVTFSPCGKYLVSSSSDYTARLWELPRLKLIAVLSGHKDDVEMAAFHNTKKLIATASRDHTIRIYDYSGHNRKVLKGHQSDVISVYWTGDDVVSCGDDGTIRRWDVLTGKCITVFQCSGTETDTIVATTYGDIYTGNDEGTIIHIQGSKEFKYKAHAAGIKRLVCDERENLLISLSYDRQFILWKINKNGSLSCSDTVKIPAIIWPRSCSVLEDHNLAFATFGSSYAIYKLKTKKWDFNNIQETHGINAITLWDNHCFSIGDAGIIKKEQQYFKNVGSLCNFIISFGNTLLTGGHMGSVYDVLQNKVIYQFKSPLNCAASFMTNNKKFVIIGSYTGEALVFEFDEFTKKICHRHTIKLHENAIKGIAASRSLVFSVCADTSVCWMNISDFSIYHKIHNGHERIANGCVSLTNDVYATVSRDKYLRIWRNKQCQKIKTPHNHSIKCVAANPSGEVIATGSYDGFIAIYDLKHGKWMNYKRLSYSGLSNIIFDEKENQFLASSYDGRIYAVEENGSYAR